MFQDKLRSIVNEHCISNCLGSVCLKCILYPLKKNCQCHRQGCQALHCVGF